MVKWAKMDWIRGLKFVLNVIFVGLLAACFTGTKPIDEMYSSGL